MKIYIINIFTTLNFLFFNECYHIMSLYDKYYSQHNKSYMYDLIAGLIKKDHNVDVSNYKEYNLFFETNFKNTFNQVNTEELSDLNKKLLMIQMNYYQDFMKNKQPISVEDIPDKEDIYHTIMHSFQRHINLKNSTRNNYRIKNTLKQKQCQLEKVILPIEDTNLFMNPIIILCLDTHYIELHLRGTIQLRHREYGIYTPFYEKTFSLNSDILQIQLKNQLYNLDQGCDVFKIEDCNSHTITILSTESEFKEGDFIRISNYENLSVSDKSVLQKQYKIKQINYKDTCTELEVTQPVSNLEGFYIMNMSLQHSIHLTYN